jgi:hypothetical protein
MPSSDEQEMEWLLRVEACWLLTIDCCSPPTLFTNVLGEDAEDPSALSSWSKISIKMTELESSYVIEFRLGCSSMQRFSSSFHMTIIYIRPRF